jgi:putative acetyltransferase
MNQSLTIRKIIKSDNELIAAIIRRSLEEFNANKPGTVYYDPTTDNLETVFKTPRSAYFIAELNGLIVGGAGIFPTEGLDEKTCELVKMYVTSNARGKGIAGILLQNCIHEAKANLFENMYLETMPELTYAIKMYEKSGFEFIKNPMGCSGHTGCNLFMIKRL